MLLHVLSSAISIFAVVQFALNLKRDKLKIEKVNIPNKNDTLVSKHILMHFLS